MDAHPEVTRHLLACSENGVGSLVWADPGTGKTRLGLESMREVGVKHLAVAVPSQTLAKQWRKEADKWGIEFDELRLLTPSCHEDEWFEPCLPDGVIFDESHTCRNATKRNPEYGRWYDLICHASKCAKFAQALTATPAVMGIGDLAAQMLYLGWHDLWPRLADGSLDDADLRWVLTESYTPAPAVRVVAEGMPRIETKWVTYEVNTYHYSNLTDHLYLAKLDATLQAAREYGIDRTPKCVISTARRRTAEALVERFGEQQVAIVDGKQDERERFIKDPNCRIAAVSVYKATGLDGLQVADTVIVSDWPWHGAGWHQFVGRIRRRNSPHSVLTASMSM